MGTLKRDAISVRGGDDLSGTAMIAGTYAGLRWGNFRPPRRPTGFHFARFGMV